MKYSKYLIYGIKTPEGYLYIDQSNTSLALPYSELNALDRDDLEVEILEEVASEDDLDSRVVWWTMHLWRSNQLLSNRVPGTLDSEPPPNSVGRRCAELRLLAELTQKMAGERIGVGLQALKDLESGTGMSPLSTVNMVLDFYGHTLSVRPLTLEEKD